MAYKKLALKALQVNNANDRHGELENETAAIGWLFTHQETYMRNLARDLATTGEVYEPPLVCPSGDVYLVFDGNRRLTCLKLLAEPKRAPSVDLQDFFADLRKKWLGRFPTDLQCQVETNRERIDDILYRRHTGTQGGVGRSPWTDRMTANFVERTGKGGGVNVADEIERRLRAASMLPKKKIPWSTANRLLSSEGLRNQVGISVAKGRFQLLFAESVLLPLWRRLADDLARKEVVLGDLWRTEGKQAYLDRLASEGLLPSRASSPTTSPGPGNDPSTAPTPTPSTPGAPTLPDQLDPAPSQPHPVPASTAPRAPRAKPTRRTTLIPQVAFPIVWTSHTQRHRAIWEELQFDLKLEHQPNATSVLFRVLLELAVDNYITRTGLAGVHPNDKLSLKAVKVGEDLLAKGEIDAKYVQLIRKLPNADGIFSIDTLNKYVHSADFAPSPSHLTALWDQAATLIVHCLNA